MTKRGPNTPAGKAAVRGNALKHGVLSTTPVIPGLESKADWEAHRNGIISSLAPEGHLEFVLAEDIALTLWRRQRVLRYEIESILSGQLRIDEDLGQLQVTIAKDLEHLKMASLLSGSGTRPNLIRPDEGTLRDRLSRERLLPNPSDMERVTRYEAHLSRRFERTLHELEALQARRRGQMAPLARIDVQGIPEN